MLKEFDKEVELDSIQGGYVNIELWEDGKVRISMDVDAENVETTYPIEILGESEGTFEKQGVIKFLKKSLEMLEGVDE